VLVLDELLLSPELLSIVTGAVYESVLRRMESSSQHDWEGLSVYRPYILCFGHPLMLVGVIWLRQPYVHVRQIVSIAFRVIFSQFLYHSITISLILPHASLRGESGLSYTVYGCKTL